MLQDKSSIVIVDAQKDEALRNHQSIVLHNVRSVLAVRPAGFFGRTAS